MADRAALLAALRERDIVHVAAHAEHDFILLSDGPFTVSDFSILKPPEIRCRLIVLSACSGGLIKNPNASLAFQFVSRGMNMIGSTDPLDDFLAKLFFGDLYRAWLPGRRSGGVELATAIRQAAEALRHDNEAPRTELDALLLYGDPTLHFDFR
jgi:CHAT domain-containing protein